MWWIKFLHGTKFEQNLWGHYSLGLAGCRGVASCCNGYRFLAPDLIPRNAVLFVILSLLAFNLIFLLDLQQQQKMLKVSF